MSTNTLRKHTSTLFASRGCDVDQALQEAAEVIDRLPKEDQAHAMTALMLVVNTAANAFDQSRGPSPERIAVEEMVRELVNQQLAQIERLEQFARRQLEPARTLLLRLLHDAHNLGEHLQQVDLPARLNAEVEVVHRLHNVQHLGQHERDRDEHAGRNARLLPHDERRASRGHARIRALSPA